MVGWSIRFELHGVSNQLIHPKNPSCFFYDHQYACQRLENEYGEMKYTVQRQILYVDFITRGFRKSITWFRIKSLKKLVFMLNLQTFTLMRQYEVRAL